MKKGINAEMVKDGKNVKAVVTEQLKKAETEKDIIKVTQKTLKAMKEKEKPE